MKKDTIKFSRADFSLSNAVFAAVTTLLLFLKSYSFYSDIRLAEFPIAFSFATVGIHLLLLSVLMLLMPKRGKTLMMIIYTVLSVFMAIDAVYFSYVSKMPSAALLKSLFQLAGVTDTIEGLMTVRHVMLIADLPLWFIWCINRRFILRKSESIAKLFSKPLKKRYYAAASFLLSAFCAFFVIFFPNFEPKYMMNELFCYHTHDFYVTLTTSNDENTIDKSKYASPDYSSSEYYGLAEGRNVFVIQVEAMQNFVIGAHYEGQEITPTLNSLIANDSIYFENYYYQIGGGNTSDAEFHVNNSLFAPESSAAYVEYPDNDYYGLPYILKDNGYSGAYAFHNYTNTFWNRENAYVNQGFDDFISLEDLEQTDMFPMGLSDKEMFRQSLEMLKTYEEPFYAFYVTVSSHHPYALPLKDRGIVLNEEDEGTLFGLYIQAMNYVDSAIAEFIEGLKEIGLYENSVFVIYGDHYALSNTDSKVTTRFEEMLGRNYTLYDVFNVPLIINIPCLGYSETKSVAGGHIDTLPTLLCLMGIHNDKAVMFGQNLLEAESGIVCEQTHLGAGSFISDEVLFSRPHNNIKSNYDAYEKGTMIQLDPDLFMSESDRILELLNDCAALLAENDIWLE